MKMKLTGWIALLTRIPKIEFFLAREALISGEELPENSGKWPKPGKPIVMKKNGVIYSDREY